MGMTQLDPEQAARQALNVALRTASPILGSRDEASDVAQDVATEVLRSLRRLRDPDAFDAWVYRITVRHTMRAVRKRKPGSWRSSSLRCASGIRGNWLPATPRRQPWTQRA